MSELCGVNVTGKIARLDSSSVSIVSGKNTSTTVKLHQFKLLFSINNVVLLSSLMIVTSAVFLGPA